MATYLSASAGPPERRDGDSQAGPPAEVLPGSFARSVPSEGVDRPPSIREVETHREHIRLNLENWEKQWADVLRYERAKVEDDAHKATMRRAITRAGACFALAAPLILTVLTDGDALSEPKVWVFTVRDMVLMTAATSVTLMGASVWYAWHIWRLRRRFKKSRTRPLLPPERLDAVQLLASLTYEGDPLYYRERDVDPDDAPPGAVTQWFGRKFSGPGSGQQPTAFGWKRGFPEPPTPGE